MTQKTVLIPSNEKGFIVDLVDAYFDLGYNVAVGVNNFYFDKFDAQVLHIQWPEELTNWSPPNASMLALLSRCMGVWAQKAKIIVSVHNLFPHGYGDDEAFKNLYETIYGFSHVISHFSLTSQRLVYSRYPITKSKPNVVHNLFNYQSLKRQEITRGDAREQFGLAGNDFVVLVVGALRRWQEVQLLRSSFSRCRVTRKRILVAARYVELGNSLRQRFRRLSWYFWLRTHQLSPIVTYIPDIELVSFLEAADVVVVPRISDMSSGIVPLAMTFGKIVVAPNNGAFPEYLRGTKNPLYECGDSKSLAEALDSAARLDRCSVGEINMRIASEWSWCQILNKCLHALNGAARNKHHSL